MNKLQAVQTERFNKLKEQKRSESAALGHGPGLALDSRSIVEEWRKLQDSSIPSAPSRISTSPKTSQRRLHEIKEYCENYSVCTCHSG